MPRKRTKRDYFHQETDDAILMYVSSQDQELRDKIYKDKIEYAFFKLTENIIHTFKFYYLEGETVEDLQQEVICFLLTKLPLFNPYKTSKNGGLVKAYSYFGTIAKRYCIIKNKSNYKKLIGRAEIDEDVENKFTELNLAELPEENEFINIFMRVIKKDINKYIIDEIELRIIMDIITLLDSVKNDNNFIFNKKAIYIYLREMGNVDTVLISKAVKKLKYLYKKLFNEYYKNGYIKGFE